MIKKIFGSIWCKVLGYGLIVSGVLMGAFSGRYEVSIVGILILLAFDCMEIATAILGTHIMILKESISLTKRINDIELRAYLNECQIVKIKQINPFINLSQEDWDREARNIQNALNDLKSKGY